MPLSIQYIDTCYPDYLADFCTDPGECLIGVPVDRSTKNREVMERLIKEMHLAAIPMEFTDRDFREAVSVEFPTFFRHFDELADWTWIDDSTDIEGEASDENPSAWFRISWGA